MTTKDGVFMLWCVMEKQPLVVEYVMCSNYSMFSSFCVDDDDDGVFVVLLLVVVIFDKDDDEILTLSSSIIVSIFSILADYISS